MIGSSGYGRGGGEGEVAEGVGGGGGGVEVMMQRVVKKADFIIVLQDYTVDAMMSMQIDDKK